MGFKLPDLNKSSDNKQSKDVTSKDNNNTNNDLVSHSDKKSDAKEILSQGLNPDDADNQLQDFTDEDIDEEIHNEDTNNMSFRDKLYDNADIKYKTVKGIISNIDKRDNTFYINIKNNKQQYLLTRKINNGNIDSLLSQATINVPISIQYDDKKTSIQNDIKVFVIEDINDIDLSKRIVNGAKPKNDDNSHQENNIKHHKKSNSKKNNIKNIIRNIVKFNNNIGEKIYNCLGILCKHSILKIPFIGKILAKTKYVFKFLFHFWILILIFILFLLFHKNNLPSQYNIKQNNLNINISNISTKDNTISLDVLNNSSIYSYYYLTATITQKGNFPLLHHSINCSGPSIGQNLHNKKHIILKCDDINKNNISYAFDIHNTN